MYFYGENEPKFGLSELAESLGGILTGAKENLSEKLNTLKNIRGNYRFECENGTITLEAVVTGHMPENIHVRYNHGTKTLKVVDDYDAKNLGEETPWYYNELNLEFQLPETTIQDSFTKILDNGILKVRAYYETKKEEPKQYQDEEI